MKNVDNLKLWCLFRQRLSLQGEQNIVSAIDNALGKLGLVINSDNEIVSDEEQGEQKPANKIEPKFHEGEWVVQGCSILKIRCVGDEYYCFETVGGYVDDMLVSEIDSLYHLWTIQDAKDGDVLCYGNEISLYKHDIKNCNSEGMTFGGFVYYCCYDGKRFVVDSLYSLTEQDRIDIHPATKEQHDLLFQKMHEAGYEWDAEKKELKKIEQKPTMIQWKGDNLKEVIDFTGKAPQFEKWFNSWNEYEQYVHKHNNILKLFCEEGSHYEVPVGAWIVRTPDGYNIASKSVYKQKPSWSKEDEERIDQICDDLKCGLENFRSGKNVKGLHFEEIIKSNINWLKSLKDRVQLQPKQEWSDEDFNRIEDALWHTYAADSATKLSNKVKSLRPQSHWKPSTLQIEALESATENCAYSEYQDCLRELIAQLKKLKG